jgi:hypothetical protein
MVSQQELQINESKDWDRAERLIFRGKGYASQGDTSTEGKITSLQYKVRYLQERGIRSAVDNAKAREQQTLIPAQTQTVTSSQSQTYSNKLPSILQSSKPQDTKTFLQNKANEKFIRNQPQSIPMSNLPDIFRYSQPQDTKEFLTYTIPTKKNPLEKFGIESRGVWEYNRAVTKVNNLNRDIRENFKTDVKRNIELFKSNPESFTDKQGVLISSTKEGLNYQLTPDYFKTLPSYKRIEGYNAMSNDILASELKLSSQSFYKLPTKTKFKLATGEAIVGITKASTEVGYSSVNFILSGLQNQVRFNEKGERIKENIISYSGFSKSIINTPTIQPSYSFLSSPINYVGESLRTSPYNVAKATIVSGGLIQQGGNLATNIKSYGVNIGIKESFANLSPIRFKSNTFQLNPKEELFKEYPTSYDIGINKKTRVLYSYKETTPKYYSLSNKDTVNIKYGTAQLTTRKGNNFYSISKTTITNPNIKYVGGEFIKGNTRTSFYTTATTRRLSNNKNIFETTYINTLSNKNNIYIDSGKFYTTVRANKINNNVKYFQTSSGDKFSGFVKVDKNTVEYIPFGLNVNRRGEGFSFIKTNTNKGTKTFNNKGTSLKTSSILNTAFNINVGLTSLNRFNIKTDTATTTKPIVTFQTTDIKQENIRGITSQLKTTTKFKPLENTSSNAVIPIPPTITTPSKVRSVNALRNSQTVTQALKIDNVNKTKTITKNIVTPIRIPPINNNRNDFKDDIFNPPTFAITPFSFDELNQSSRRLKGGRRRTGYTPSFSALLFNIRGSKPRGVETGIGLRPITKGFKFTSRRRKLKLKI